MANKSERLAGVIRKNLAEIIQMELNNPHLGFITISDVMVSGDISYATIYVSFVIESQEKEGIKILERSKGFIRSKLAYRLDTRRCPELRFVLDEGYKKEARISELLDKE